LERRRSENDERELARRPGKDGSNGLGLFQVAVDVRVEELAALSRLGQIFVQSTD
jgi:hypothetical protein